MGVKSGIILMTSVAVIFGMMVVSGVSMNIAEAIQNSVTVTPINEKISLQKTTTTMSIPADNKLPWGTVKGAASDYVERYPVIIQFYQDEDPVHVAQVDVKGDGSYEYRFRVGSTNQETGGFENIFVGDYVVKIYRVIPNTDSIA